jgi:hypothetical protein
MEKKYRSAEGYSGIQERDVSRVNTYWLDGVAQQCYHCFANQR